MKTLFCLLLLGLTGCICAERWTVVSRTTNTMQLKKVERAVPMKRVPVPKIVVTNVINLNFIVSSNAISVVTP